MELEARLIMELPEEGGTSRNGNQWRKKSWVFETFGQYPRKAKVDAMNAQIDNLARVLEVGKTYTISIDPDSREFNGRWYTDLRIWQARESQGNGQGAPAQQEANPFGAPAAPAFPGANAAPTFSGDAAAAFPSDAADDLPF